VSHEARYECVPVFGHRSGFKPRFEHGSDFVDPASLSDAEFAELVTRVRSGEVRSLRFRARVFADRANANLTRPEPGRLGDLASDAPGGLFLTGHWGRRLGTVFGGGTVTHDGVEWLTVTVDITDPGAQEDFLRGNIDRFSIGIRSESAECSICGTECYQGWFGPRLDCEHRIGEMANTSQGEKLTEVFLTGELTFREVSSVNFPAVDDTALFARWQRANETGEPMEGFALSRGNPASNKEPQMADKKDNSVDFAAQLAELKAKNEALEAAQATQAEQHAAQLKQANDAAFQSLFDAAVTSGRVVKVEEEDQRQLFAALGAEKYRAALEKRKQIRAFSEIGSAAGDPGGEQQEKPADPMALLRYATAFGVRGAELDETETLKRIGFSGLRIRTYEERTELI